MKVGIDVKIEDIYEIVLYIVNKLFWIEVDVNFKDVNWKLFISVCD